MFVLFYITKDNVENKIYDPNLAVIEFYARKLLKEQPTIKSMEITKYNGDLIRRIK